MSSIDRVLRSLGAAARESIAETMRQLAIDPHSRLDAWRLIHARRFSDSVVSLDRQLAILRELPADMSAYRRRKKQLLTTKKARRSDERMDVASFWNVETSSSPLGHRLTIGLKNGGCTYWKASPDKVGCTNCGYFLGVAPSTEFTPENLLEQLDRVIAEARGQDYEYDRIEFLNDGSFLADEEVPPEARIMIFERLAEQPQLRELSLDTRPEHVTAGKLDTLFDVIRDDQRIDLAIGLETTDPFISSVLINKGYGVAEVEEALHAIAGLEEHRRNRISVWFYTLVKPAYLTEREAIEGATKTARDFGELAKRHPNLSCMKLEPAVISEGSLLEILYAKGRQDSEAEPYAPPSYWSVLEIVARCHGTRAGEGLRVATREDMDSFHAFASATYENGALSRHDFLIYNAIQWYVAHRSMARLLAQLEPALEDRSFAEWRALTGIDEPQILTLFARYRDEIRNIQETPEYSRWSSFVTRLRRALDEIEYDQTVQKSARERWFADPEGYRREIQSSVSAVLSNHVPDSRHSVTDYFLRGPSGLKLLSMRLKLDFDGHPYAIWASIPTARAVRLEEITGSTGFVEREESVGGTGGCRIPE